MAVSMSAGPPTCRARHSVSAAWRCEVRGLLGQGLGESRVVAGTLGLALLSCFKQYFWLLDHWPWHNQWILASGRLGHHMACLLPSYSSSVTRMVPQRWLGMYSKPPKAKGLGWLSGDGV